jgi:hypothetical protein
LGYLVADWIEANCAIPDGEFMGDPFILTDEQFRFVLWHYRLKPKARADRSKPSAAFLYRRSQLVRPQKWGKGPLGSAIICAEAEGPVLFDGWDANGEPVGRPWPTPWIQTTAVSEDQTDNVWRALLPMIELGAIAADLSDTGLTRINLPGGGYIEPVTAAARSRLGQRITFSLQDQTESWLKRNGGHALADNQRRNLAGMGGRSMETPNCWDPSEGSVAQITYEAKLPDVHIDYTAPPEGLDYKLKKDRRKIHVHVYGDSAKKPKGGRWRPWIDLDRIEADALELLPRDPNQAARFFGNMIASGADKAFDIAHWRTLTNAHEVTKGEMIVLGVDGARYDDALAIIATHVESGYQWVIGIWERPKDAPDDYEHPFNEVDQAMLDAFDRWKVWRVYIDPQRIEPLVNTWQGRWGEKRVIEWMTWRKRQMAYALRNYLEAIGLGELSHDADPVFTKHVANACRKHSDVRDEEGKPMFTIEKDRPGSPEKIDGAMAGTISWEARGDCIAAGGLTPEPEYATASW